MKIKKLTGSPSEPDGNLPEFYWFNGKRIREHTEFFKINPYQTLVYQTTGPKSREQSEPTTTSSTISIHKELASGHLGPKGRH